MSRAWPMKAFPCVWLVSETHQYLSKLTGGLCHGHVGPGDDVPVKGQGNQVTCILDTCLRHKVLGASLLCSLLGGSRCMESYGCHASSLHAGWTCSCVMLLQPDSGCWRLLQVLRNSVTTFHAVIWACVSAAVSRHVAQAGATLTCAPCLVLAAAQAAQAAFSGLDVRCVETCPPAHESPLISLLVACRTCMSTCTPATT